jgi:uncharacterized protein (TIGR04255 family)
VHYPRAPIIDATISLGIVPPATLTADNLSNIRDLLKDRYPKLAEEYFYAGEVSVPTIGDAPQHEDIHGLIGYSFSNDDQNRTLRVTVDSFDFSVGQPYDRWRSFRDEAIELWEIFKEASGAIEISRVALRYINRIDIPNTGLAKLEDFFKIYLEIPEGWPGGTSLTNFFVQFRAPQQDLGCELVVNQAPAPPPESNMVSVRLDFDLFKELYSDSWHISEDAKAWQLLEQMRLRKNDVFNASITKKTKELIS